MPKDRRGGRIYMDRSIIRLGKEVLWPIGGGWGIKGRAKGRSSQRAKQSSISIEFHFRHTYVVNGGSIERDRPAYVRTSGHAQHHGGWREITQGHHGGERRVRALCSQVVRNNQFDQVN